MARSPAWSSRAGKESIYERSYRRYAHPYPQRQMRGKSTVMTPASKLRAWVLDVLADEGYIRGYEK